MIYERGALEKPHIHKSISPVEFNLCLKVKGEDPRASLRQSFDTLRMRMSFRETERNLV